MTSAKTKAKRKTSAEIAYSELKDAIVNAARVSQKRTLSDYEKNFIDKKKVEFCDAVMNAYLSGSDDFGRCKDNQLQSRGNHFLYVRAETEKGKKALLAGENVAKVLGDTNYKLSGIEPRPETDDNFEKHAENLIYALGMSAITIVNTSKIPGTDNFHLRPRKDTTGSIPFIRSGFMEEVLSVVSAKGEIDKASSIISQKTFKNQKNISQSQDVLQLNITKGTENSIGVITVNDENYLNRLVTARDGFDNAAHLLPGVAANTFGAVCCYINKDIRSNTPVTTVMQREKIKELVDMAKQIGYNVNTPAQLADIWTKKVAISTQFNRFVEGNQEARSVPTELQDNINKRNAAYTDLETKWKGNENTLTDNAIPANVQRGDIDDERIASAINALNKCKELGIFEGDAVKTLTSFCTFNNIPGRGGGSNYAALGGGAAAPLLPAFDNNDMNMAIHNFNLRATAAADAADAATATAAAADPHPDRALEAAALRARSASDKAHDTFVTAAAARDAAVEHINLLTQNDLRLIVSNPDRARICAELQAMNKPADLNNLVKLYHSQDQHNMFKAETNSRNRENKPAGAANGFVNDLKTHKKAFDVVQGFKASAYEAMTKAERNPTDLEKHINAVKALTQLPTDEFPLVYRSGPGPMRTLKHGEAEIPEHTDPDTHAIIPVSAEQLNGSNVNGRAYYMPGNVREYLTRARDRDIPYGTTVQAKEIPSYGQVYKNIQFNQQPERVVSESTNNVSSQYSTVNKPNATLNTKLNPTVLRRMELYRIRNASSAVRNAAARNDPRARNNGQGAQRGLHPGRVL